MSDRMIIENSKVTIETEEGARSEHPESLLVEMLRQENTPPLGGKLLPDGIKFMEWRDPFLLVVHQYSPHVRRLLWIDERRSVREHGPGVVYRPVRLSLPYTLVFAFFYRRGGKLYLTHNNELYFRNQSFCCESDQLFFPALLNISRIETPRRRRPWICTNYLECPPRSDWTQHLDLLLHHLWDGGFNLSSEQNGGASWYTLSKGLHRDLHPVKRWERATKKNPRFALSVPWTPVPLTFRELVECIFEESFNPTTLRFLRGVPSRQVGLPLAHRLMNFRLKAKGKRKPGATDA